MADQRAASTNDPATSERRRALAYAALSLVMAGAVAFCVWWVVDAYEEAVEEVLAGGSAAIVVAARDLESGAVLRVEDLALAPNAGRAPSGSVFTDVKSALGQTVGDRVLAGEPVRLERLLIGGAELRFHEVIDHGSRALTLRLDREAAVGGLLRPGHFVDVNLIAKQELPNGKTDWVLETLLQSVRVVAVDAEVASSRAGVEAKSLEVQGEGEALVTLELDPPEARAVALATVRGHFYLTLRSLEDFEQVPLDGPLASADLIGLPKGVREAQEQRLVRKRDVASTARAPEAGILFIRGGKSTVEFPAQGSEGAGAPPASGSER